nr:hypothetical protein [Planctomycetota bacterium]
TWALLCRYVPPGSMLFAPSQPEGMRVLAARHEGRWTVVMVNRRAAAAQVRVVIPGAREQSFQLYVYAGAVHAADADGFPMPTGDAAKADAGDGVLLTCPPESAIIATSME